MDDLSFEEFEIEYKYLKAVIEGGLEKKPENVLIYATSNCPVCYPGTRCSGGFFSPCAQAAL